jgi:GR25 family glycosyltransferase involved in LPS biosynthesis
VKFYVITIMDNKHSVEAAERCIESGKKFGYSIEMHPAFSPKNDPHRLFQEEGLHINEFKIDERYSRLEPCMCGFLSHRSLWKKSLSENIPLVVLEHDAIFLNKLPNKCAFDGIISFGKPSYGKYKTAKEEGVYKLFSKVGGYLPGAHAYCITPVGAKRLLDRSLTHPAPTDLFLNNTNFPTITEYYPWPVMADDKISTIQNMQGCVAKHNYKKGYGLA